MKNYLTLLLLLPVSLAAQTRSEFWLKLNMTHALNQHWNAGVDFHHRRQANFNTDDKNIFHYPLGTYARAWITYKLQKGWTVILSPVGYFHNEDILNRAGELKQTNELRISPGLIKELKLGRAKFKNRLLYDARFADYNTPFYFFQSRFRLQNNLFIPFINNSGLGYLFSNEIILKNEKGSSSFDQNRVYNAIQYKISNQEVNAGYQWVLQKGNSRLFHRNQFFIQLNLLI